MKFQRLLAAVTTAAALTTIVAGCGDTDDPSSDKASDSTATTAAGSSGGGESTELDFTAADIKYEETDVSAPAGELHVTLTNDGSIEHAWEIEDHEDDLRLHVTKKGDTDDGTITLEPGTYTYYCNIPGHRDAGMEGTLTVK
jgi:plastocyanin